MNSNEEKITKILNSPSTSERKTLHYFRHFGQCPVCKQGGIIDLRVLNKCLLCASREETRRAFKGKV